MKLNINFTPDLVDLMRAEVATGQKAVSATMAQAGAGLKSAWRGQTLALGSANASPTRSGRRPTRRVATVWTPPPSSGPTRR